MASVNYDPLPSAPLPAPIPTAAVPALPPESEHTPRTLHRIRTVRLQQGVSLRTMARHTGRDTRTLRQQEQETSDLQLSDLYTWQRVLDVPVSELLVDSDAPLSRPVMERAQLIRVMKTAAAILERAPTEPIRRMAETLVGQLVEIMPELSGVSPWHTYGQRRSLDEYGKVMDRCLSEDQMHSYSDDE